jgi:hypothetical protein
VAELALSSLTTHLRPSPLTALEKLAYDGKQVIITWTRKSSMLTRAGLLVCLAAFLTQLCISAEPTAALPPWLIKAIEAEKRSPSPGSFYEEKYSGKRVFEYDAGGRRS